jgi:hypothetical protein
MATDTPKPKQPSMIFDQEITTKNGHVIVNRFGAAFEREDGSHGVKFESHPLVGDLVVRTPQQRIERLKQLSSEKSHSKDEIER